MTFDEARTVVLLGGYVRRPIWPAGGYAQITNDVCKYFGNGGVPIRAFHITEDWRKATDWEIYQPEVTK